MSKEKKYRLAPVSRAEFIKRFRAEHTRYQDEHDREKEAYQKQLASSDEGLPSVRPSLNSLVSSMTVENWLEGENWPSKDAIDRLEQVGFRAACCIWDIREV